MKISWNQMLVLGWAAAVLIMYAPKKAEAQEHTKPIVNSTEDESTLTPEEKERLNVDEQYVFDENVPG